MTSEKRQRHDNDEQVLSTQEKLEQLYELIDGIEVAMLTSHNTQGALVSRPMATQKHTRGGIWFVTSTETHKIEELRADPRVNLAYYKDRTREFVSVSGVCRITQDRAKIAELHKPDWRMWFGDEGGERDGGPGDPRIVLLEVEAHSASYLKSDRPQPVVLFNMLKGMLTGEPPHVGEVGQLDRAELSRGKARVVS